uniref:LysR family substrate-binding domain-containing protein n=1 Tax=Nocardia farcinica TaxID=37329 RepID=UPI00245864CD
AHRVRHPRRTGAQARGHPPTAPKPPTTSTPHPGGAGRAGPPTRSRTPPHTAAACRALVWRELGADPDDPATWPGPVATLGDLDRPPFLTAANTPALHTAFDTLVGAGRWQRRTTLGGFVIRFPAPDPSVVDGWHVDVSFPGADSDPGDYLTWRANVVSRDRALLMLFLFTDVGEADAPTRLARMTERYPDIEVLLWEKRTGPQLAALADGTLDLALVYGRPSSPAFRYRRLLHRIPLVAVVGRRHRWAERPGVPFAELAGQDCVLFAREQCPAMYDAIFRAAAQNEIALAVTHHADDPGATAHMVSVRPLVGFASLPRAISMGMGSPGNSPVAVKLFDPVPTLDLYAVWRADKTKPAVEIFLECLEYSDPVHADSADATQARVG